MGAKPSKPPPPPKVSKKLAGTTIQLQHLPPLITEAARDGIRISAEARYLFLAQEGGDDEVVLIGTAHERLSSLIIAAHKAANFRDYLTLLIEKAILGLSTRSGRPSAPLMELACLVNPFLSRRERDHTPAVPDGSALDGLRFEGTFRPADLEHVADEERDVLVLLYYCCDMVACADEAIEFVSRVADKGWLPDVLQRRKESFSEVEIYVLWTSCYIASYLTANKGKVQLRAPGAMKLQVEMETNLKRLATTCETLLAEHRLDQICFLLQLLEVTPTPNAQAWYRRRFAGLANGMKKKRAADRALRDWHVAVADRLVQSLTRARHTARDRWGWRAGAALSVGDGRYELHKAKRD